MDFETTSLDIVVARLHYRLDPMVGIVELVVGYTIGLVVRHMKELVGLVVVGYSLELAPIGVELVAIVVVVLEMMDMMVVVVVLEELDMDLAIDIVIGRS